MKRGIAMIKDDISSVREILVTSVLGLGGVIGSVWSILVETETWLTFGAMAAGVLSLMRATQIAVNLYRSTKTPTFEEQTKITQETFEEYMREQDRSEDLIERVRKEAVFLSGEQIKGRRHPPTKKFDK